MRLLEKVTEVVLWVAIAGALLLALVGALGADVGPPSPANQWLVSAFVLMLIRDVWGGRR